MTKLTKKQIAKIMAYNENPTPMSAEEYDEKITQPWIEDVTESITEED